MKRILSVLLPGVTVLFSISSSISQEIIVRLEEDYTNPKPMMWRPADEYYGRSIKDGMYITKPGMELNQLAFSPEITQKDCELASDMEFTIVKLQGGKDDFIQLHIELQTYSMDDHDLDFQYNEAGEWNMNDGYHKKVNAMGRTEVNQGKNVLKLVHRRNIIKLYMNNKLVVQHQFSVNARLKWSELVLSGSEKRMQIGLDKVVLTGYPAYAPLNN